MNNTINKTINSITMKKIILTSILAVAAMNSNAQLVVDSLGRVGIGTDVPEAMLSVGYGGNQNSAIYCKSADKKYGMQVRNNTDSISETYCSSFYAKNLIGNSIGVRCQATGDSFTGSLQRAIGLKGVAGRAYTSIGVYGGVCTMPGYTHDFAGVYGSSELVDPSFIYESANYSGTYAGYFDGCVRVTEGIYATVLSPTSCVSSSGQSGTTVLSDRGESVTAKLSQVQTVQFLRYDPAEETSTATASIEDLDLDDKSPDEQDSLLEAMSDGERKHYLSPVQYGLDAAQLKAVYPELVYEDANGNVSINYVEMVPLLVQSINELSARVAELEGNSAKKAKAKAETETTSIEDNVFEVDMVRMDQNKPNPFSESTVITLNIPARTQSASILIYDMSGKQVQSIAVAERGETNITVYASDLTAGMYIYTLVVDGKVAVTRRMIVER